MARKASSPPRSLIVDDDYDIRAMLSAALGDASFAVATAGNGELALRWLRNTPELPTVILLDRMLPVMTGWEFRLEQQGDPRLARIPVIMLSARRCTQHESFAISADDFVRKPVDVDDLLRLLERYN